MYVNKVILCSKLTRLPEYRGDPEGLPMCRASLVTKRVTRNGKEHLTSHNFMVFESIAHTLYTLEKNQFVWEAVPARQPGDASVPFEGGVSIPSRPAALDSRKSPELPETKALGNYEKSMRHGTGRQA